SIRPSRSSSNFTFATRYPRENKAAAKAAMRSKRKSGGSPFSAAKKERAQRNLHLPSRLRLADVSSSSPSSSSFVRGKPSQGAAGKRSGKTDRTESWGSRPDSRSGFSERDGRPEKRSASASRSGDGRDANKRGSDSRGMGRPSRPASAGSGAGRLGQRAGTRPGMGGRSRTAAPALGGSRTKDKYASKADHDSNSDRSSRSSSNAASNEATSLFNRAMRIGGSMAREQEMHREKLEESRQAHSDKFALMPVTETAERTKNAQQVISKSTFESMKLHPTVLSGIVEGMQYEKPTAVQAICIPKAVSLAQAALESPSGGQVNALLCAAETGTGKTIAYLASVMHFLKTEEDQAVALAAAASAAESSGATPEVFDMVEAITASGESISASSGLASIRKLRRPRAVVLVPSRDLVTQVAAAAKLMSHHAKMRVMGVHGKTKLSKVKELLSSSPIDLLVTTPASLQQLVDAKAIALSQTRYMVVDEADTLLDTNFKEELLPLMDSVQAFAAKLSRPALFLFTTATLPKTLVRALHDSFPPGTLHRLMTPNLHKTPAKLHQVFLRLDASTTKDHMLLDILKRAVLDTPRVLVFCNRRDTCDRVAEMLGAKGFDVARLSSSADVRERAVSLQRFVEPPLGRPSRVTVGETGQLQDADVDEEGEHDGDGESESESGPAKPMIMVATDMASRGLDTTQVGHVVLYDFPQTAIDYIHRVGRTARNGRRGRSTAIVTRRDAQLAEYISNAVRRRDVLA
ncbi:P-loop containing nucleoside triphosphate hydrolase protein, partial [Entophlyctis helioformis]